MAKTTTETANYLGELFMVGQNKTPFLNMIGGTDGANAKYIKGFKFPLAVTRTLGSPSQPAITENQSASSNTATTIARTQDYNVIQIFQETVEVTYSKLIATGEISGIANSELEQRIINELEEQKMLHLRKMARNMNYTFLNGTYQDSTDADTAYKSRGVITAITTNAIDASSASLSKELLDQMFKSMADNGSENETVVVFVNSFQKQQISNVYGYAPESINVGGVNVQKIVHDFGEAAVVFEPTVPAGTLVAIDIAFCNPVFALVGNNPPVFYEELAKVAASVKGQLMSYAGLNYGPEENHAKITNLATS